MRRVSNLIALLCVAFVALSVVSCQGLFGKNQSDQATKEWDAFLSRDHGAVEAQNDLEKTVYLDQNWDAKARTIFYRTPQGSHVIPLKFALALEKHNSGEPFFSNKNLSHYGFVLQSKNPETNPYGLPVGFTVDGGMRYSVQEHRSVENGERYLGVNCALCHTSNLRYKGQAVRIDGGQTLVSFQDFVRDMDFALKITREDKAKLERFLSRVSELEGNKSDKTALMAQLDQTLRVRGDWTNLNDANHNYGHGFNDSKFVHGPGRIDAFAVIFNQVLARDLGVQGNAAEPDAPVSPPVIWDAPHHDWVQWNGLASNDPNNGGPLARNIGQVLGVFGEIDLKSDTKFLHGYCSSARRQNLESIEEQVKALTSPHWPKEVFGALNDMRIARGKKLFEQQCSKCHDSINRIDPERKITARLIPMKTVGTETKFNDRALARVAQTANLAGRMTRLKTGRPLEASEPSATVLRHAVAGAIAGSVSLFTCSDDIDITRNEAFGAWEKVAWRAFTQNPVSQADDSPNKEKRVSSLVKTLSVYKARPLNGIWASPPFLHNGSVKSLYDLLLPPEQRKNFYLGCDHYDPVHAGLDCASAPHRVLFETSIDGNRPVGHAYGPRGPNAEEDRMALIEYLKSL